MATSDQITDGKSFILSVINSSENLSVTLSDVTFGLPVKPTGALPLRNTKVIITPKSYSGYYGVKTVWYNRIHINQLGTIKVEKGTATHAVQLIPAINEKYGIFLTDDDIIDDVLPVFQTGEITVNLQISPKSYMFYSGDLIITQDFDPGISGFNLIPSVWDTDYKSVLITNSSELNSLQVINSDPGISMIRTNNSFVSGKRYFEFSVPTDNGVIGLATAVAGIDTLLGSDANSIAIYPFEGKIRYNNEVVFTTNQLNLFGNRTIGLMVDLDEAKLGFILQGNVRVEVPNLILPTEPLYVVSGNTSDTKLLNNQLTNFGQIPFKYTVPVGYVGGFGIGGSPVVPTAGALVRTKCIGFNKIGIYANGEGGTYSDIIESNSPECGYGITTTAPTTTPVPTSTSTGTSNPTTSVSPTPTGTTSVSPTPTGTSGSTGTTTITTAAPTTSVSPTPTLSVSPTGTPVTTGTTTTTTPTTTPVPTSALNLGINWVTTDVTAGDRVEGVVFNNGLWVTFSQDGTINTSTNLLVFTENTTLKDKMADLAINDPLAGSFYPSVLTFNAIKIIDGIYFVSGDNGWIYTSTDLTTWNAVNIYGEYGQSTGDQTITTVEKIGSLYVAGLKYTEAIEFISSTDGITWSTYSIESLSELIVNSFRTLGRIVKLNGKYFAYTVDLGYPVLFSSVDGDDWTLNSGANTNVKSMASNGTRIVSLLLNQNKSAYSDDNGVTWTTTTGLQSMGWTGQNNVGVTQLKNLIYDGDKFIVVGAIADEVICATSTDGITWDKAVDLDQYVITNVNYGGWDGTNVTYGNYKLVLFAGLNTLAVSPNLTVTTTTPVTTVPTTTVPTTTPTPTPTFFLPNAVVMDGADTGTPGVGVNWVKVKPSASSTNFTYLITSVLFNGFYWIMFDETGVFYTSADLISFTPSETLKTAISNNQFCSTNGITQPNINNVELQYVEGLYFIPIKYGVFATSRDLINWDINTDSLYVFDHKAMFKIVYTSDNIYTIICTTYDQYNPLTVRTTTSLDSADGIDWVQNDNFELATIFHGNFVSLVLRLGNYYYAYGNSTTTGMILARSLDGKTWTTLDSLKDKISTDFGISNLIIAGIAFNGSRLLVIYTNTDYMSYSDDNGVTWTNDSGMSLKGINDPGYYYSVIWTGTKFVLYTSGGIVFTSNDGITWSKSTQLSTLDFNTKTQPWFSKLEWGKRRLVVNSHNEFIAISPYITEPVTTTTPTTTAPPPTTTPPATIIPTPLNITWTTTTIPGAEGYKMVLVHYDANYGRYIIITSGAGIITSEDDFSSVYFSSTLIDKINDVLPGEIGNTFELQKQVPFFENGYYCVFSRHGWLFTSNDLSTWNAINVNSIVGYPFGEFGGSVYCPSISKQLIFCIDGSVIASGDYFTWTTYGDSNIDQFFSYTTMRKAIKLNNYYYAYSWNENGSYTESFARSADGITWEALTDLNTKIVDALGNTAGYLSLASNGSRLVMLLGTAYLTAYSEDNGDTWNISWNLQSLGWDANLTTSITRLSNIEYIDGMFVIVGGKQPNTWLAHSFDGITWARHTPIESSNILRPQYLGYDAMDVISSGTDKYLVYANNGKITTSFAVNLITTTTPAPTYLTAGTIIGTPWCSGFNKEATVADGAGGSYSDVIEVNSPDCGYVATTSTPTTTPTPTVGIQWANTTVVPISVGAQLQGSAQICAGLLADTANWVIVGDNLEMATTTDFVTYTSKPNLRTLAVNYADGMGWNDFNQLISRKPYSLSKVNNRYFVMGTKGALFSSLNLTNWSIIIFNFTDPTNAVSSAIWIGSDNRYRFISNTGDAFVSSIEDGVLNNLTWDNDNTSPLKTVFNNTAITSIQVKKLGSYFYAFSKDKVNALYRSTNGTTWTNLTSLYDAYSEERGLLNCYIKDIAFDGTTLIVMTATGHIFAYSNDNGALWYTDVPLYNSGITWATDVDSPTSLRSIVWTGAEFVAVGMFGNSVTSTDGVTWTEDTDLSTDINSLPSGSTSFLGADNGNTLYTKYGNGKLVVLADSDILMVKA